MSSRHELTGVFLGIRPKCQWENEDGTLTIIGSVRVGTGVETEIKTIKGVIYQGDLVVNVTYRFYGQTKEHHKHGSQFCFEAFTIEQPVAEDAVIAYLSQCNGIGPRTARAIWCEYGEQSVQMLRESPEVVASVIPRLTEAKAKEASDYLKSTQSTERTKMDLLGVLKGRGFPKKVIEWLIRDFGPVAATLVHRNPYILMRYKGCGFLKTDKMYLDLRHNPSRMKRQALCAWYAVAKQSGGDTWFPFYVVRQALAQQISSANLDVEKAMQLAIRGKMLVEKFHKGQRFVAEYTKARDEEQISNLIEEARREFLDNVAPLLWAGVAERIEGVTDHQRENAILATWGFIGVLAGRPGTGKTYTVARIVRALKEQFGEQHIAIAAPTGKAAVRVTAAMQSVGLSVRATTLHSLLGFTGDGFEFRRDNPLPFVFIIVDESSMIDVSMMRALLDARAEGAHILFVGDPNQLAPIGHGAPLRDFIVANVAHGELTEIQRNSGRIVRACSEIVDHNRITCSPKLDPVTGENLLIIERHDPESQIETLTAVMQRYQRDAAAGGIDPIWDVQIIVAVNAKSELGRKPLNKRMQELLNPDGESSPGNPFRVGDKIINTKNASYKAVLNHFEEGIDHFADKSADEQPDGVSTFYVANGEQAEVLSVDTGKIIARLTSPDRTILIPRSSKSVDDSEVSGDGEESEASTGSGCAWELGYCISGHKSQGSEWPVVVTMLDEYPGAKMVESKQWLYTSVSRAKRLALLIGRQSAANDMCQRDALFRRKTFLSEQIDELRDRSDSAVWRDKTVDLVLEGVC